MKSPVLKAPVLLLLSVLAASPLPAAAGKSHANGLTGTIASVDPAHKSLVVRERAGRETRLLWTGATRISGGALKRGEKVTVRWVARDGKKFATVLRVGDLNGRPTPPTPLASRSPTAPPPP